MFALLCKSVPAEPPFSSPGPRNTTVSRSVVHQLSHATAFLPSVQGGRSRARAQPFRNRKTGGRRRYVAEFTGPCVCLPSGLLSVPAKFRGFSPWENHTRSFEPRNPIRVDEHDRPVRVSSSVHNTRNGAPEKPEAVVSVRARTDASVAYTMWTAAKKCTEKRFCSAPPPWSRTDKTEMCKRHPDTREPRDGDGLG